MCYNNQTGNHIRGGTPIPADVKQQITDALLQLLDKKSLEKITVRELAELCGISRQTFYYHFEDVFDVVDWWSSQGAEQMLRDSMRAQDEREALRIFVDRVTANRGTLRRLLASRWREQMERQLVDVFTTYLRYMLRSAHPHLAMSPSDESAFLLFYASGVFGLLIQREIHTVAEKEILVNQLYWLLFQDPWGHIRRA